MQNEGHISSGALVLSSLLNFNIQMENQEFHETNLWQDSVLTNKKAFRNLSMNLQMLTASYNTFFWGSSESC